MKYKYDDDYGDWKYQMRKEKEQAEKVYGKPVLNKQNRGVA